MKRIRTGGSTIQAFCWLIILWVSVLGLSINAYAGLRDGLIAYYPFDGGPMDAGPDGYHGIEYNGVSLSADRVGNPDSAYSFDGHDDYISAGNFNLPLVFSVSMWVNPHDTADGRMFFGKPSASGNPLIAVGFSNGGYSVVIGTVSYSEGIKTTGWQHLAVVVEKNGTQYSRVLFYKNGQLLWSKNNFYQVKDTGLNLISMGSAWSGMSPANFFSGQMDDVRLYDRALAQTEIELLYNPVTGLDVKADDDIDGEDLRIFAKNVGQTRWYKDQDKDGYSDGTTRWSQSRPDEDYYSAAELNGVSGDCDDLNPGINPAATGAECPPFGGCCYTADENCIPVTRCEDNVSERICINELNGTFHENRQCAGLSSEECPVGAEPQGACCVSQGDSGLSDRCIEARTKPQCMDIGGKWYQDQLCADLTENECPSTGTETGACCRPKISYVNESGVFPVQCLDSLTEYKCQLLQGSWFRARTCDSLSQEECPPIPPVTGACCRTMLSGDGSTSYAVCDSMTGDECAAVDGSFFADRQCSELSSEECPIQAATGACCHPKISYVNESGVFPVQCLDKLTEYKCKILQGSWYQDQKCADLDGSVCAPYGACCYEDAEGIKKCANWMLESSCSKLSGTFHANQTCAEVECVPPPAVGACCLTSTGADGSTVPVRCVDARTQTQCTAIGGSWYEEKNCSQLSYEECPPIPEAIGACCSTMTSGDGSTTAVCNNNVTISQCSDIGGSFFADRQCSELSSAECPVPVPTGACCHPKISYVNESGVFPVQCLDKLTEYKCKILQGSWYQDQKCADLDGSVCPPYGACCYTDAQGIDKCANWMLESACTKLSGEFKANQTCAEAQCVPPAAVGACCLTSTSPDGSTVPVRCVDARTQAQCTTMGGSWYEEQNCSELTYEQCPPIQEIQGACCQTMMSGDGTTTAVCNDDVTTSACADAGGSFYADRQCSDLSSAECPVPVPTGACCHPKISYVNESGVFPVQCLDKLTEYKCKLLQGSWYQDQKCADLDGSVCPPYGACCYTDAQGIDKCANWMLESACTKLSGEFKANQTCAEAQCVPPAATGACCLSNISTAVRCVDARTQTQCTAMGGSWYEEQNCSQLSYEECPPIQEIQGACCQTMMSGDGTTTAVCNDDVTTSACADAGGSFYADRQCSDLSSSECPVPVPTGACCHPKISYVNESGVFPVQCLDKLTEYKCKILQGSWYQDQKCADLDGSVCPPYGACCYKDAQGIDKCANWMLESACTKLSGEFNANQTCAEAQCVPPAAVGACCLTSTSPDGSTVPVRCVDARTQAQCTTMGGSWYEEQNCSELTYEQCPPIQEIQGACCQTMMSGDGTTTAVCNDDVTTSACADAGGSFYADRQCSDLSSAECPVPVPTGACCHPKISYVNESGVFPVQCLDKLTEYKCKLLQGSWYQEQTCEEIDGSVCPPYGACCYKDAEGIIKCANWMLESNCKKLGGKFSSNRQCSDLSSAECQVTPIALGACCLSTISTDPSVVPVRCVDARSQAQCKSMGGSWFDGENCEMLGRRCPALDPVIK